MSVYLIHPDHLDAVWEEAEEVVRKAYRRVMVGYTQREIKEEIRKGFRQLWIYDNGDDYAVCITHISESPHLKTGVMAAGGGTDISLVEKFFPRLEEFFKSEGCTEMEMIGAPGWGKYMKKFGFKEKYISTVRKL